MDSSVVFCSFDFYKQDFYEHSVGMYVGKEVMAFWYINIYLSTEPNRLGPHLFLLENKLFSKVIAYNLSFYGYNFSPTGLLAI